MTVTELFPMVNILCVYVKVEGGGRVRPPPQQTGRLVKSAREGDGNTLSWPAGAPVRARRQQRRRALFKKIAHERDALIGRRAGVRGTRDFGGLALLFFARFFGSLFFLGLFAFFGVKTQTGRDVSV